MKLSKQMIERMIFQKCSKNEINFIVLIAQWQNDEGVVHNLYYKDVTEALNIPPKSYFHILNNLEKKSIIKVEDSDVCGYRHITLIQNDFSDKNFHRSYLNIDKAFMFTKEFFSLKATEKYVLFKILLRSHDVDIKGIGKEVLISEETVAKYANINAKNRRLITSIVEKLQAFQTFGRKVLTSSTLIGKTKAKVFSFAVNFFGSPKRNKELYASGNRVRQIHMFKSYCKKHKIPTTDKDIDDLIQMENQYKKYSNFYIDTIIKYLQQYKLEIREKGSIDFVCAIIRNEMTSVIFKLRHYYSDYNNNGQATYLI